MVLQGRETPMGSLHYLPSIPCFKTLFSVRVTNSSAAGLLLSGQPTGDYLYVSFDLFT